MDRPSSFASLWAALAAMAFFGWGTTAVADAMPQPGSYKRVLSHPERLQPVGGDSTALRWIDASVDFRRYDKVLVERIRVRLDADSSSIDPSDLKSLTDYFHASLVKSLDPRYQVVDKPGPGVLRVRITLVDLVQTKPEISVAVLVIPYSTVPDLIMSGASGGPLGSAPYLGRTGIAAEFIDGAGGQVVAEYAETHFGRKYVLDKGGNVAKTLSGTVDEYAKSFSTWAYAQEAFDGWAKELRTRLDQIQGRP